MNNFNNNDEVTNNSLNNTKKALSMSKKPISKLCKTAIKTAVKIIKYIFSTVLSVFGPFILVVIGIFFVFWVIYDEVFDSKGTEQDLQCENTKYSNDIKTDSKDGDYKNVNTSRANRLLRAFYTVKSEDSYYVQLDNGKLVSGSSKEAQKLKDKYGREKMFYLNPDILWTLDEMLNNNKFRYPEQFLKPVCYDKDDFKLKNLTDKKGNLVAESVKYKLKQKDEYESTDDKSKGIWDYGFASVLKYKEYEETKKISGTYTKKTYYNKKTGKVEWKDINENFTASYEGYPKKVNLITDAVTPAGTITNKMKFDEQTSQVVLQPGTGDVASDSQDVVVGQETVDEYGWVEKTKYEDKKVKKYVPLTEDVYDPALGHSVQKEVPGKTREIEVVEKVPVKYKDWDKTGKKVTFDVKKRKSENTQVTEKIPQYDGEPNPKEITGNKYFFEYMQNYNTYIPKNVLDKFDFEKRTGKSEDKVFDMQLGGDSNAIFPGGSISANFEAGQGASGDSYKKALQYLPQAKALGSKYGVDPAFIIAMICKESSGNPNDDNGVAYGLMQYNYRDNPSSVKIRDVNGNEETLNASMSSLRGNPEQQIKVGIAEMQQKLDVVGNKNVLAMLVAYNMGEGNLANQFVKPYLSSIGKSMNPFKYLATGDNGWFKYEQEHAKGEAKVDLQHLFKYYKSLDGSSGPWMVNKDKQKISVNLNGGNGDVSIASGSCVTQDPNATPSQLSDGGIGSWLKSCYNEIKASIKKLFTDIEYSDKNFKYSNKLSDKYCQNTVNLFFALQDKKRFSDVGDITDKDWKTRYKELFKNPLADDISGQAIPQVNPTEYFTNGEFTSPISGGTIIKAFGLNGEDMSNGIVVSATEGSKVYSVANDGKVIEVGSNEKYGKYITIEYSNDTQIIYGNLKSTSVKKNDTVKKGQEIGKVGNTKTSSIKANGLYLELQHKGATQDPSWIVTGLTGGGLMGNGGMPIPAEASELAKKAIGEAKKYLGSPYAWGGKQPPQLVNGRWTCTASGNQSGGKQMYSTGFDCSGLVGWSISKGAGVDIGWSTYEQVKHGTPISSSQLKPGDLIFIGGNTAPHHVMLYEGNMTAIEAPHTGDVIKERKFSTFGSNWVYRRVLSDIH